MSDLDRDQRIAALIADLADYPPAPGDWTRDALCAQVGGDFWFPGQGSHGADHARKVCAVCPVRQQCAEYALATRPAGGIWAGMSIRNRQDIQRDAS